MLIHGSFGRMLRSWKYHKLRGGRDGNAWSNRRYGSLPSGESWIKAQGHTHLFHLRVCTCTPFDPPPPPFSATEPIEAIDKEFSLPKSVWLSFWGARVELA